MRTEDERAGRLLDAQANAVALFDEVVARGIIAAGRGEQAVSDQIRDLANEMFEHDQALAQAHRAVRPAHPVPYRENPPDRIIEADDIVFADFGPIFEEFEADLGRTYVLGDDPVKHRLAADLPVIFGAGRRYFGGHPGITGAQLYAEVAGWPARPDGPRARARRPSGRGIPAREDRWRRHRVLHCAGQHHRHAPLRQVRAPVSLDP